MDRKAKASRNQPVAFHPEGDLDIFGIGPLWEQLLPLGRESGKTLCLDLAGVGDLDLSGMQALLLLARALQEHRGSLALRNLRPEWRERFDQIGLEQLSSLCEQGTS